MKHRIIRISDQFLEVVDARCDCGGLLRIEDHGGRGEYRYELFCHRCKTCDPNGYGTLREIDRAVDEYFNGVPA